MVNADRRYFEVSNDLCELVGEERSGMLEWLAALNETLSPNRFVLIGFGSITMTLL